VPAEQSPPTPAPPVGYLVRDLFFGVRIGEGLRRLGLPARPLRPEDLAEECPPLRLLIVDLGQSHERWLPAITAAHATGVPVLAFGSHMDQVRWQQARDAGATRVVANSQLAEHFGEIVQRLLQVQSSS
jgi:hypothetical protein